MSGPFVQSARDYLAAGWNPIPMEPCSNKSTPPAGFTGYNGRAVTAADVARWCKSFPAHHVALRMPAGVIGIDVDDYDDKHGAAELDTLETELGPLPPTWSSTSRAADDEPTRSAIWFYRIPVGVRFPTRPCPDVEFIQCHHRYAVVAPSVHKLGRPYKWYEPSGAEAERCPELDELAELPWVWVEHFARRGAGGRVADAATTEAVAAFIDAHTDNHRPEALNGVRTRLAAARGSRHDTLIEVACWAMREAAAGHYPAAIALDALAAWWQRVMDDPGRLAHEFADAVAWAVAQAESDPERIVQIRAEHRPTGEPPTGLPEEFWNARPELAHIRRAAHSRARSADAYLGATLARLAALIHPSVQIPAIVAAPAPLSIFVAQVGRSGLGKTSTVRGASELLPYLGDGVADMMPLGSGEGLVELFMETVTEPDDNGKQRTVKRQTRHGAYVYLDEGQALAELGSRKGSTLLPMLRTAWSGATLGSSNASAETKRKLPAGSYALGLVIGFQTEKAAELLADATGGTPQRFEWVSGTDTTLPDELPSWPGPLRWTPPRIVRRDGEVLPTFLEVPESIAAPIRRQAILLTRGETELAELDSHATLARLKVAALLAVLDGRLAITDEDWELSGMVQRVSHSVRATVLLAVQIQQRKAGEAWTARYVERENAVETSGVALAVERMARAMTRHVERATCDGGCRRTCMNRATASRDRQVATVDAGLDRAVAMQWLSVDGERITVGKAKPS